MPVLTAVEGLCGLRGWDVASVRVANDMDDVTPVRPMVGNGSSAFTDFGGVVPVTQVVRPVVGNGSSAFTAVAHNAVGRGRDMLVDIEVPVAQQALDDAQADRDHEELVLREINALKAHNASLRTALADPDLFVPTGGDRSNNFAHGILSAFTAFGDVALTCQNSAKRCKSAPESPHSTAPRRSTRTPIPSLQCVTNQVETPHQRVP